MRTVLLASLKHHTRRYVAAALAVAIGVAFIVMTNALTSAARDGLTEQVATPYENADLVLTELSTVEVQRLIDSGLQVSAMMPVYEQIKAGARTHDISIAPLPDPGLAWQEAEEGRLPQRTGEIAVDVNAAKSARLAIGDRVQVGTGDVTVSAEVVGLVRSEGLLVPGSYLVWDDIARWADQAYVDNVAVAGPQADELVRTAAPEAVVHDVASFVDDQQAAVNNDVDVIGYMVLLFVTVALFVSVLVIANTFTILFAQRMRDFALLRCVGATRRQVLRSIRREALALGVAAAGVGVGLGIALGFGLVALIRQAAPGANFGQVSLSLPWLIGAFVIGVLVTVVAAWLPTRRVVRVSPLAAMRPDPGGDTGTMAGRLRIGFGAVVTVIGVALLALAVTSHSIVAMLAGGVVAFTGVLLLGPVLVPGMIRLLGRLIGQVGGPTGRLAVGNAVRNPRRTAATTASLLIGVTLTTAVLTGMATTRAGMNADMDKRYAVDAALVGPAEGLPDDVLAQVRTVSGVEAAAEIPGTVGSIEAMGEVSVIATGDVPDVLRNDTFLPGPGEIAVPWDLWPNTGLDDEVTLTVGEHREKLTVVDGNGWGSAVLVAPQTLEALTAGGDAPVGTAIWVRADDGADAEDLVGDLETLGGAVSVQSSLAEREFVEFQLDVLTYAVVGLLGISVVIALLGIANTIGLSVLERARENSLLRALGLTRRQLRATLAGEAALLSVVATVLGTVLGVVFAWVGVQTLIKVAIEDAPMVLPWGQLAVVVLVSAVAGLVASVLPSRRAAAVTPAAGLALD